MFLPFFSVLLPLNTGKELGSNLLAVLKCNAYPQLFLFVFELELSTKKRHIVTTWCFDGRGKVLHVGGMFDCTLL